MARKKTFAEKIAETPTSELSSMTQDELMKEVKKGRYALNRRLGTFARAGLTSAAAVQYFDTGKLRRDKTPSENRATRAESARNKSVGEMSRNQLLLELARIQSFFRSKTSTVAGQKAVNLDQDRAIFGSNARGVPRDTMSPEEREVFWSIYQEYYNQHPETYSKTGASESVQSILGEIIKNPAMDRNDLAGIIEELHQQYEEEQKVLDEVAQVSHNVYTGRGNLTPKEKWELKTQRGRGKNVRTKRGNRRSR